MSRVLKSGVEKTHSPHRDFLRGWRWMNRSLHYHSLSLNVSPSLTGMEGLRVHAVGCGLAWYIREYSHILIVTAFVTLPQTHHFFKTASCRLIRVGVYRMPIGGVSSTTILHYWEPNHPSVHLQHPYEYIKPTSSLTSLINRYQ